MSRSVAAAVARAKIGADRIVGKSRQNCRSIVAVMRALHRLWPRKAVIELQLRTEVAERTAERWLKGQTEISASALVDLLRSDVGREVLIAAMGDARPAWWIGFRRHLKMVDLVRAQSKAQRDLDQLQREFAQ